jgi:glutaredoxin
MVSTALVEPAKPETALMRTKIDQAIRNIIKKDRGIDHGTYPKVFLCGTFIGGFSDLDAFLKRNGKPFHCRR